MAVYADDGSLRVSVVDGSTFTGAQAPDGSLYVVVRTDEIGRYHSCGALLVTPISTNAAAGALAPDGSLFVSESPYFQTSQKITVVSGSLGASIAAPAITWNSLETDNEPDFLVDLPSGNTDPTQDAAENDHLIIEYQLQSGGSWTGYIDRTLTAGDITNDTITVTGVGSVANGDYFFRARIERPSPALVGTNSANEGVTINVVAVPVNSVAPVISGNVQVGQTLTTTDGTWSNSPTGYTYQWKRDGGDISGATANTHVLVELDAGADITCAVTASNGSGAGSPATSNTLTTDVYLVNTGANPVSTADLTTYTFSSQALGTAAANRIIVVSIGAGNISGVSANVATVTVDGNSATRSVQLLSDSSSNRVSAIYRVAVPTGTTGDVVVTFTNGQARCGVGVYAMYGATITEADTDSAFITQGTPTTGGSVTLTVPAKGVAVGVAVSGGGTPTCTWTGLTENFDQVLETSNSLSGASLNSNAGGNIAMQAVWTSSTVQSGAVYASWGV